MLGVETSQSSAAAEPSATMPDSSPIVVPSVTGKDSSPEKSAIDSLTVLPRSFIDKDIHMTSMEYKTAEVKGVNEILSQSYPGPSSWLLTHQFRWWTWPASFRVSQLIHTIPAFIREPLEQWTVKLNELYTLLGAYRNRSMPSPWATNQQENVYRDICLLVNNQKDESIKTYTNALSWQKLSFVKVPGNISPSRLLYRSEDDLHLMENWNSSNCIEEMLWHCIIGVAWGCWTSDTGLTNFLTEAAPLIRDDSEGADTWFSDAFAALVQCNQILRPGVETSRELTSFYTWFDSQGSPPLDIASGTMGPRTLSRRSGPIHQTPGLNINDLPTIELSQIGEDASQKQLKQDRNLARSGTMVESPPILVGERYRTFYHLPLLSNEVQDRALLDGWHKCCINASVSLSVAPTVESVLVYRLDFNLAINNPVRTLERFHDHNILVVGAKTSQITWTLSSLSKIRKS
ncbi:uncharacterized protein EV420DRAFT_1483835 [Desarmillaria tabescens]|uniref:Uncharacterized protein n=1 Tax=Armillaria tabescens TaxID=1929756 RepID=A0AA39JRJ9_ARMTA|nr:uncharacterized protein EV420DRAFT_1483835 [Desarmillaria tabescens]KAK0447488.1 hypothetical protein EV420DRAFT_1483835 [Desarmillaria tabescens]